MCGIGGAIHLELSTAFSGYTHTLGNYYELRGLQISTDEVTAVISVSIVSTVLTTNYGQSDFFFYFFSCSLVIHQVTFSKDSNLPVRFAASAMRNVVHDRSKNKAFSNLGKFEIFVSLVTYTFLSRQGSPHNKTIPFNICKFHIQKTGDKVTEIGM